MINPETLRKGPPQREEAPLAVLTDQEVRGILDLQLGEARWRTEQIVSLLGTPLGSTKIYNIFSMSAEEPMSTVYNGSNKVGLCERGKFQEIAFEAMTRYGLNPNVSQPHYESWGPSSWVDYPNGTSREILKYPSQTIPRLDFIRWRDFYTETGETIYVNWYAEAYKKPFSAHFGKLIPKNPQIVEI
ncbi:MAG: hypothetical protein M1450_02585 [Patescibacteria group bacterium]|nr:hypothetical protein [Patescibacteria group bacterium]